MYISRNMQELICVFAYFLNILVKHDLQLDSDYNLSTFHISKQASKHKLKIPLHFTPFSCLFCLLYLHLFLSILLVVFPCNYVASLLPCFYSINIGSRAWLRIKNANWNSTAPLRFSSSIALSLPPSTNLFTTKDFMFPHCWSIFIYIDKWSIC